MHRDLITSLSSYKAMMEFKLLDFEADKKAQYDAIRVMMAEKYPKSQNYSVSRAWTNIY